ncbi:MAG: hypothetical protein ACP5OO_11240, partial [Chloroflexia bacterium]
MNRTFLPPRREAPVSYPVAQWCHGDRGMTGGLEIPVRHFADAGKISLPVVRVPHSEGWEEAFLLERFHLALVGWRPVRWERRVGAILEVAPPELPEPWKHGYRSRRQILTVVREMWEAGYHGFLVLSFRASAAQYLSRAL